LRIVDFNEKELTRAKNAAYRLLTYRPRSRAELRQKLQDKEFDQAVIEAVVSDLARLGYVNDRQFAEQWASSRVRLRAFGRRRIEQELRRKGVDREVIVEALAVVFGAEPELGTAMSAAEKKLNTMRSADRETRRRRLAGFLERKGYSYEIIRKVINERE
jgi:regulatory protein